MSKIVLDFGSGNTCKNDLNYAKRMVDELRAIDSGKHEVIIKWQLFQKAGDNVPLSLNIFSDVYYYAKALGYKTTASVFDIPSLEFLLNYNIPFVKIANNPSLYHLSGYVPRNIPIYISVATQCNYLDLQEKVAKQDGIMCCVSNYPASLSDYEIAHNKFDLLCKNISDHTEDFELFNKYTPDMVEWHYKLEDSTGLDAGSFARTPNQLKEVLL
jgi:sialic acid synthase SpsE